MLLAVPSRTIYLISLSLISLICTEGIIMDFWKDLITDMVECVLINAPFPSSDRPVSHWSFDLHHCTLPCFAVAVRNACVSLPGPHRPIPTTPVHSCDSSAVLLSLSLSHTQRHIYTHTSIFIPINCGTSAPFFIQLSGFGNHKSLSESRDSSRN